MPQLSRVSSLLDEESKRSDASRRKPPLIEISFSSFLINTSDRIIRVYDAKEVIACGKDGEPEPIQKLQDLVNK